jgi:hypothetical protein
MNVGKFGHVGMVRPFSEKWDDVNKRAMQARLRTSPQEKLMNVPIKPKGSATPPGPDPKAEREKQAETVSQPGGFKNDPDDPTNPNEAIERSRRQLRERIAKGG